MASPVKTEDAQERRL